MTLIVPEWVEVKPGPVIEGKQHLTTVVIELPRYLQGDWNTETLEIAIPTYLFRQP